jgi:hypothetical protein
MNLSVRSITKGVLLQGSGVPRTRLLERMVRDARMFTGGIPPAHHIGARVSFPISFPAGDLLCEKGGRSGRI